jgi:signal transduction histidine kinase
MKESREQGRGIAGMSSPTGRLAWSLCALSLTFVIVWASFRFLNFPSPPGVYLSPLPVEVWGLLVFVLFTTIGALVASRQPKNTVGWILCALGLLFTSSVASGQYAIYALASSASSLPGGGTAAWLEAFLGGPINFTMFALLLLLFPNGRPPLHRWRAVLWLDLIAAVLLFAGSFKPGPMETSSLRVVNPFGIEEIGALLNALSHVGLYLTLAVTAVGAVSLMVRFRRSRAEERQQIKWFAFAGAIMCAVIATGPFLWSLPSSSPGVTLIWPLLIFSAVSTIPLATGIAILKYRLYDIDRLINRTLVYGALTVCIVGIYVLVVGYLGAVFASRGNLVISIFAAGLVATIFQPLRERLQRIVNRLTYGERDDPYRVLARLGRRLEATIAPEAVLPAIVENIALALRLPQVAVWLADGDTLRLGAAHGSAPTSLTVQDARAVESLRHATDALHPKDLGSSGEYGDVLAGSGVSLILPLTHQGAFVGALCLAPRSPGEEFSPADLLLLRDLATQSGAAAHEVQLTGALRSSLEDLRRSRERLLEAQEEERRRIQRDLHDGLGPLLASMRLRLEACLEVAERTDIPLSGDLERLYELVGEATADVRLLVYDLRPPVLDQLGLVPAIRQHCERFGRETGIETELATAAELSVPAAAEVTVLRLVQEALVNVQKHAQASRAAVRLERQGEWLLVGVADDGKGLSANGGTTAGTGLLSMRERAELLGGRLKLNSRPGGGTDLLARIPVRD